ncbi:hypothetical protein BU17DRAFT_103733 [Hysterangium stoloniferum]|nr:hypothetical protein BU17DRAFT_103733 [Hysterangium stoloniferum]
MKNIERNWSIVRPRDGSSKYPKSKIEQLPYDIHLSIFNALQVEDAVSLAITCWVMWDAIKKILPAAMETVLFPLVAHHRIICVGNYVLNDDYPRGMLTEEELAEVSKAERLYSWIREFEDWDEDNGIFPPAAMVPGSHDLRIFQEIVDKKKFPLVRVVRNMSKKEYIRESGITAEAGLEEMGVTQAILSRIFWSLLKYTVPKRSSVSAFCLQQSHDPSSSMAYQGDIHRGTWAGDCIDIMCENRHDAVLMAESKDPSKAPWKDVTEACVQMLLDIRSAEISAY